MGDTNTYSYISEIQLPSGGQYRIKDIEARDLISALGTPLKYVGTTTTQLTDGSETSTIVIAGENHTAAQGDVAIYGELEFVYNGSKWQEFGSSGSLKALAFEDTAEGSYTPAGNVTVETATTTNETATVSTETIDSTHSKTYTPAGSVSLSTENIAATVGTEAIDATHAKTYTPAGSVSFSNSNVTAAVSTETVTEQAPATYTPAGSVAAPTISVATAGSTATIANPTAQTVAKTVVAAAPGATAPDNSLTYYAVSGEVLSLYQLGYTTGDSISTSDVTVKTGDAAYEASAPAFSGTSARLVTGNISVPSSATFTGTDARLITENIAVPSSATFSGEDARLVTGNIAVPATFSASFSGTAATISVGAPSTP